MVITGFILSIAAVLVAGLSLGWNIYRDVIIKPRLKVSLSFSSIIRRSAATNPFVCSNENIVPRTGGFVLLEAVNHGPGEIRCTIIMGAKRRGIGRQKRWVIFSDDHHEASMALPTTLSVGQPLRLVIPFESGVLDGQIDKIGIKDAFGRIHWAPRKTLKKMTAVFQRDELKRA